MKTRVLPDLRRFARRRAAVFHGKICYIDPAWRSVLSNVGYSIDSDWLAPQLPHPVSTSEYDSCHRLTLADGRSIYVKRARYPRSVGRRYFLRPSRPGGELYGTLELAKLGVRTIKTIAYQEIRNAGILQSVVMITEGLDNVIDLNTFAQNIWLNMHPVDQANTAEIIKSEILKNLNKIHAKNFFHGDLFWRNILLDPDHINRGVILMDCPKARYRKFHNKRGCAGDLAALGRQSLSYLTAGQRSAFVHDYLSTLNSKLNAGALLKEIERRHREANHPPKIIARPPSRFAKTK